MIKILCEVNKLEKYVDITDIAFRNCMICHIKEWRRESLFPNANTFDYRIYVDSPMMDIYVIEMFSDSNDCEMYKDVMQELSKDPNIENALAIAGSNQLARIFMPKQNLSITILHLRSRKLYLMALQQ